MFGVLVNLFKGFGTFGGNNNNNNPPLGNNNNNNPLPLPPSGFREGLRGGFNLLSERNVKELNTNVATLINVLTGANLGINYAKRELNYVKLTEFEGTEAENPNE